MNNDLISRSELLDIFDSLRDQVNGNEVIIGLETVSQLVESVPAIDAEPVRHGRWTNKTEPQYAALEMRFDCSACHHIFYSGSVRVFRYCPNCGAKMDGD